MRKQYKKSTKRSPRAQRRAQLVAGEPRVVLQMSCMTTSAESATEISHILSAIPASITGVTLKFWWTRTTDRGLSLYNHAVPNAFGLDVVFFVAGFASFLADISPNLTDWYCGGDSQIAVLSLATKTGFPIHCRPTDHMRLLIRILP